MIKLKEFFKKNWLKVIIIFLLSCLLGFTIALNKAYKEVNDELENKVSLVDRSNIRKAPLIPSTDYVYLTPNTDITFTQSDLNTIISNNYVITDYYLYDNLSAVGNVKSWLYFDLVDYNNLSPSNDWLVDIFDYYSIDTIMLLKLYTADSVSDNLFNIQLLGVYIADDMYNYYLVEDDAMSYQGYINPYTYWYQSVLVHNIVSGGYTSTLAKKFVSVNYYLTNYVYAIENSRPYNEYSDIYINELIYTANDPSQSYEQGYKDGLQQGYDIAYNEGYQQGLIEGAQDLDSNGFKTLVNVILNSPYNILNGIFNFELFGINVFSLITFVLTAILLGFVIKLFI